MIRLTRISYLIMGSRKYSCWCKPMERYLTTYRSTKQIYHGLVHKEQLTIAHHTTRSFDLAWYIFHYLGVDPLESHLALSLNEPRIFNFFSLYYDDVLRLGMDAHNLYIFKTCLLKAQLSHDHPLDHTLNTTLVMLWSSSCSITISWDTRWILHLLTQSNS